MRSLGIPVAVLSHARRVADQFHDRTGVTVDAEEIITGRAALLGFDPGGRVSAGGATRLMPARDGWCAITLSRPDDGEDVPALVESDVADDPWSALEHWVAKRTPPTSPSVRGFLDSPLRPSARPRPTRRGYTPRAGPRRTTCPSCWSWICRRCGPGRYVDS